MFEISVQLDHPESALETEDRTWNILKLGWFQPTTKKNGTGILGKDVNEEHDQSSSDFYRVKTLNKT